MKMRRHTERSSYEFTSRLPIPRHFRRYVVIQLLFTGFFLYLWLHFNGGVIPKFLIPQLGMLDVGPDISALLYFDVHDDASNIKWSGRISDLKELKTALKSDPDIIEGEVILKGQGTSSQSLVPIMDVLSSDYSETTLDGWLDIIKSGRKGIKLTFTSIEAVEISLQKLKILKDKGFLKFPVWIHADVLQGPYGDVPKIDSTRFLKHLKRIFPKCTLSLGWTTGHHTDTTQGGYTWHMVLEMFHLIQIWEFNDQQIIINADLQWLHNSIPQLKWLCDNVFHSGLLVYQLPKSIPVIEDLFYAAYRFPPQHLYLNLKDNASFRIFKKYRHFSREKNSNMVLERDMVMFHPQAWVKMGFHMEKNSVLGSTEAIILKSPIVYIVSKSRYKPTPNISLNGRVIFLNYKNKEVNGMKSGLNIYLRSVSYTHYEEIVGVRCFLGTDGTIEISGSNLNNDDDFETKSQKITPSSDYCFRFSITDAIHEIIFRVNVVYSCNTLESVKEDPEIHAELKVAIPFKIKNQEHPYILRVEDDKRYVIIDELRVKTFE